MNEEANRVNAMLLMASCRQNRHSLKPGDDSGPASSTRVPNTSTQEEPIVSIDGRKREILELVGDIFYTRPDGRPVEFRVESRGRAPDEALLLSVHFTSRGNPTAQVSRKWYISPYATTSEVVQTALLAVLTLEEHEARESFLYRGRALYHGHFSLGVLHAAAVEAEDRRADPGAAHSGEARR